MLPSKHAHFESTCVQLADSAPHPSRFVLNGLEHANDILGQKAFDLNVWKVIGEYCYDEEGGRHQAFYSPTRDVDVLGERIRGGERIKVEQSLKYSLKEAEKLWSHAAMIETKQWKRGEVYGKHFQVPVLPKSGHQEPLRHIFPCRSFPTFA
jgi:L-histidine Nalpha-methyltransferase / hercynylcysteine S-oxide synthase